MKCKVFDCATSNLEEKVNEWLSTSRGLFIQKVAPVGISNGKSLVMIFYNQSNKVAQPEVPEEQLPSCPKCTRPMMVRANSSNGDLFFGCRGFPDCNGTREFTQEDWMLFGGDPGVSEEGEIPF